MSRTTPVTESTCPGRPTPTATGSPPSLRVMPMTSSSTFCAPGRAGIRQVLSTVLRSSTSTASILVPPISMPTYSFMRVFLS